MADLERGQRIKALREAHAEYGQKHLAAAAGVSLRAYQAWEAGGGIKVENAKALAKFLKVDWRWLINGETAPAKSQTTPDPFARNGDMPDDLRARLDRIEAEVAAMRKDQRDLITDLRVVLLEEFARGRAALELPTPGQGPASGAPPRGSTRAKGRRATG
jgi:transcriptional regulator with XRE-family HTH domain